MAKISKQVTVTIGERGIRVGTLRFEADGLRQSSAFEYDPGWLSFEGGFDLSPSLPRRSGPFFSSATRENPRLALPGAISDATPDNWGRSLMKSSLGGGLTEFDYNQQRESPVLQCGDESDRRSRDLLPTLS